MKPFLQAVGGPSAHTTHLLNTPSFAPWLFYVPLKIDLPSGKFADSAVDLKKY